MVSPPPMALGGVKSDGVTRVKEKERGRAPQESCVCVCVCGWVGGWVYLTKIVHPGLPAACFVTFIVCVGVCIRSGHVHCSLASVCVGVCVSVGCLQPSFLFWCRFVRATDTCIVCKRQRLKHAVACRSMPQHLCLGPVGGGFEACRSMPQHTDNLAWIFFGGGILDQNMNPITEQVFGRDSQYSSCQTLHLSLRGHWINS